MCLSVAVVHSGRALGASTRRRQPPTPGMRRAAAGSTTLDDKQMRGDVVSGEHIDLGASIEIPCTTECIEQNWKRLSQTGRRQPELDENDVTHKPSGEWSKRI
jgi:hypothetical protein